MRKASAGDASTLEWFKSSYSNGRVEVAPGTILIRDSKNPPRPPPHLHPHHLGRLPAVRHRAAVTQKGAPG